MSAQRIQKADVIAIRHLDTVGLLKLRSERPGEGTLDCLERRGALVPRAQSGQPKPNPRSEGDRQAQPAHAGRSWIGALTLGVFLGVAIGQLTGLALAPAAARAPVDAPAPVIERALAK